MAGCALKYHARRAAWLADDVGQLAVNLALDIDETTTADELSDIYVQTQALGELYHACKAFARRYCQGEVMVRRVGL